MEEERVIDNSESPLEGDMLVLNEENELHKFDLETEAINQKVLGFDENIFKSSNQERRVLDIEKQEGKGWIKNWQRKLIGEIDILPDKVANVMTAWKDTREDLNEKELKVFSKYVHRRLEISKFQALKKEEMVSLKEKLTKIDNNELIWREGSRDVFYSGVDKKMYVQHGDIKKDISWGDVLADGEWEIYYSPDKTMTALARKMKKLMAVNEARRNIEDLYNKEISAAEMVSGATSSWSVSFIEEQLKKSEGNTGIQGVIAEKMAQNFLIRIGHKNPSIGLKIEHSNALEDVELKYDFKVVVPKKIQGVAVEGEEMPREEYMQIKRKLGIQFTVTESGLGNKRKQVKNAKKEILDQKFKNYVKKPVDDIILVSLPFKTYQQYFEKWIAEGKPSGGPEQYFTKIEKIALLKKVTENALDLSDDELEKLNI
jgi:hypothetical protein